MASSDNTNISDVVNVHWASLHGVSFMLAFYLSSHKCNLYLMILRTMVKITLEEYGQDKNDVEGGLDS